MIIVFLTIGYLALSYILLNGRLTYWTSFTESTIEDSKMKNLFITDNLNVKYEGDSLKNWQSSFNIWTNKRYEIKYFGILFHWTFEDPSWRYLHIEPNSTWIEDKWFRRSLRINDNTLDYKKGFTGGFEPCCNWIPCNVDDTVTIQFHRAWQHDSILGDIKVLIK